MSDAQKGLPDNTGNQLAAVLRAVRFSQICLILVFSYVNFRFTSLIDPAGKVFADMLNGTAFPSITGFVLHHSLALWCFSVVIPTAALASLFTRHPVWPFYLIGVLSFVSVLELAIVWTALAAPFFHIVKEMQQPPPL